MALIGVGLRSFSMPPSAIGPVKAMVRSLNAEETSAYVGTLCNSSEPSVRRQLEEYARDNKVVI
jgi:phosphotransferase system enzyme I (PtsP)